MDPSEIRQRAAELERDVRHDGLGPDDEAGAAAAYLAALAEWDVRTLRRAILGESGGGNAGVELLRRAIEYAEDESG